MADAEDPSLLHAGTSTQPQVFLLPKTITKHAGKSSFSLQVQALCVIQTNSRPNPDFTHLSEVALGQRPEGFPILHMADTISGKGKN